MMSSNKVKVRKQIEGQIMYKKEGKKTHPIVCEERINYLIHSTKIDLQQIHWLTAIRQSQEGILRFKNRQVGTSYQARRTLDWCNQSIVGRFDFQCTKRK